MSGWYDERAKKNMLWAKIKAVAELYGETPPDVVEYAKDVYTANFGALDNAIKCFDDLLLQAKKILP